MLVGIVSENYTKLSNECAKSQQRECLESIKVAVNTTIPDQKEIFLSNNSTYRFPNTTTTHMDNLINQSNDYTTDMIRWINIQNQLMVNATEALKEYVKNYKSAIVMLAEYGSTLIKAWNSSVFKMQLSTWDASLN
ncbi:MAG: hypothetical protein WBE34_00100 [Candidatus Nitrosopolaris sp.]